MPAKANSIYNVPEFTWREKQSQRLFVGGSCCDLHHVARVEAEVFISVLKSVPMSTELLNRITSNPRQCGGRPCIRGMRIRVKDVLDMLAGGASEEEILADFPYVEPDDTRASLEYAAAQIDRAVVMVS